MLKVIIFSEIKLKTKINYTIAYLKVKQGKVVILYNNQNLEVLEINVAY